MITAFAILSGMLLLSFVSAADGAETYDFKAETSKLMDIIINSLYSTRDVFMRELISNCADAIEKARVAALGKEGMIKDDEDSAYKIKISFDKEKREIYVEDNGIGMNRDELINNLGTIAESGTKKFLDELNKTGGDKNAVTNLIGQFGVGFFSAFLVADQVTVDSVRLRSSPDENNSPAYRWVSDAKTFTVFPSPEEVAATLGRGTRITLHIRPNDPEVEKKRVAKEDVELFYYDFDELLDQEKLEEIIKQYSGYIQYPIYINKLITVKEDYEECEEMEETIEESEETKLVRKCETKQRDKEIYSDELVNTSTVIWMRDPETITDSEYTEFYKTYLTKGKITIDPAGWIHYKSTIYAENVSDSRIAEDVDFTVLVFIPRDNALRFKPKKDPLNNGIKLHVNRVYVTDDLKGVIPSYLGFCFGIIDIAQNSGSNTQINLSREMLQNNKVLEQIGRHVTRKIVEKMNELHKEDIEKHETYLAQKKEYDEKAGSEEEEKLTEPEEPTYLYFQSYAKYADNIKSGIMEDQRLSKKLASALRLLSNKCFDKYPDLPEKLKRVAYSHGYDKVVERMTTLDEYIENMQPGQEFIYYLGCRDADECSRSPAAEYAQDNGFEVFYLYEPYDVFVMRSLGEYKDHKLVDLMGPRVKFPHVEREEEEGLKKETEAQFKHTIKRIKSVLKDRLFTVTLSERLTTSPCLVVSRAGTPTAAEIRILENQYFGENRMLNKSETNRILEVNPKHPLIVKLREKIEQEHDEGEEQSATNDAIVLLYETASIESGYVSESATNKIVPRLYNAMSSYTFTDGWEDARASIVEEQEHEEAVEETSPSSTQKVEETVIDL